MVRFARFVAISCFALVATIASHSSRVAAADNSSSWTESHDDALAKAKADHKLLLADFTGSDWCHFCIELKKEVLDTPDFKKWAAEHVVLLEVDYPARKKQADEVKKQNARLKDQFKIEGYPTIVILNADGKELGRIVGFGGAKEWSDELHKIMNGEK